MKKKIAVIGSGIAGCILSYTLAKKGINVDLFEKSDQICSGASSHELLVTYPKLSAHDTAFGAFTLQSYIFASSFYNGLKTDAWKRTGVIMLNHDDASEKRQSSLLSKRDDGEIFRFVDSHEASGLTGVDVQFDGLFFDMLVYIIKAVIIIIFVFIFLLVIFLLNIFVNYLPIFFVKSLLVLLFFLL